MQVSCPICPIIHFVLSWGPVFEDFFRQRSDQFRVMVWDALGMVGTGDTFLFSHSLAQCRI